ncbi:major histocompatibility complex class I-related gene protein-like [Arapaima gigas]
MRENWEFSFAPVSRCAGDEVGRAPRRDSTLQAAGIRTDLHLCVKRRQRDPRLIYRELPRKLLVSSVKGSDVLGPAVVSVILASCNVASAETVCHSLRLLVTFISGKTQFPEFTLVLMVNDVPVEYYDSDVTRIVSRRYWKANETIEETKLQMFVVEKVYKSMKMQSHRLTKRFNHTQVKNDAHLPPSGIHVYQKFAACDLDGDSLTRFFLQDAYEGEETRSYDILSQTYSPFLPELIWSKVQMETKKLTYVNVYQPLCIRMLRRYLQQDRNILLRKVRPKVRVIHKTKPASKNLEVVCLATGFYPRHINMTLLRDGQAVPDEELTAGELLPNGDGTYQLRKSHTVSLEEQRKKHLYTCTVTHLSLDNKLYVTWEPESGTIPVLCAVLGGLFFLVPLIAGIVWLRRKTGRQNPCQTAPDAKYSAAQRAEQSDTSSTSGQLGN